MASLQPGGVPDLTHSAIIASIGQAEMCDYRTLSGRLLLWPVPSSCYRPAVEVAHSATTCLMLLECSVSRKVLGMTQCEEAALVALRAQVEAAVLKLSRSDANRLAECFRVAEEVLGSAASHSAAFAEYVVRLHSSDPPPSE